MTDEEREKSSESDCGKLNLSLKQSSSLFIGQQVKLARLQQSCESLKCLFSYFTIQSGSRHSDKIFMDASSKHTADTSVRFQVEHYCKFSVWSDLSNTN